MKFKLYFDPAYCENPTEVVEELAVGFDGDVTVTPVDRDPSRVEVELEHLPDFTHLMRKLMNLPKYTGWALEMSAYDQD